MHGRCAMSADAITLMTPAAVFADILAAADVGESPSLHLGRLRIHPPASDAPQGGRMAWEDASGGSLQAAVKAYLDPHYERLCAYAGRGWRTIWFNRDGGMAPARLPVHDGELTRLEALSEVPAMLLDKPSLAACDAWLDAWALPDHIRRHSELVAWMAYVLGVMLRDVGVDLDPILAHRGGLLHDLDKLHTLESSQGHGDVGAAFVREQGYPHLAAIVAGHVMRMDAGATAADPSWETQLVFFCDKLVEQDRIVPFDVRLKALKERYPAFRGVMNKAEPTVWALSDQICSILSIPDHDSLIQMLIELQYN